MLKSSLFIGLVSYMLLLANAQTPDSAWCNITEISPEKMNFSIPSNQYQAIIEKNSFLNPATEIIREWFDGSFLNLGIAVQTYEGSTIKTYSYYNNNELLYENLSDRTCKSFDLSQFENLTPFFNKDGKISSPLSSASFADVKYVEDGIERGIPIKMFASCTWSEKHNTTVKYTISVSDGDKWSPAASFDEMKGLTSIPIKITERRKADIDEIITWNIAEFRPYLLLEEDGYFVHPGVFCEGRKNIKEVPAVPRQFEFLIENLIISSDNNMKGLLLRTNEYYDFDLRLFKKVSEARNTIITEIDDFHTGLKYTIDMKTNACKITRIAPNEIESTGDLNGNSVIRNPEAFFDFEGMNWVYNGPRKMNGVNVDTWITKGLFSGLDGKKHETILEWAWLTGYNRSDNVFNKYAPTPVRFSAMLPVTVNATWTLIVPNLYNFVDFRESTSIIAHHDVSMCRFERNHDHRPDEQDHEHFHHFQNKKYFSMSFETTDEVINMIAEFKDTFLLAAYKEIHRSAKVTALRIQNFHVGFKGNHIFFTFSIMEKAKYYGEIERIPFNDVSLEDAEFHLRNSVENNNVTIVFKPPTDKFNLDQSYLLRANPDSFNEIQNPGDSITTLKTIVHPQGYSGATVGIISTIIAIFGMIMTISLIILHKNKKITIPFLS